MTNLGWRLIALIIFGLLSTALWTKRSDQGLESDRQQLLQWIAALGAVMLTLRLLR